MEGNSTLSERYSNLISKLTKNKQEALNERIRKEKENEAEKRKKRKRQRELKKEEPQVKVTVKKKLRVEKPEQSVNKRQEKTGRKRKSGDVLAGGKCTVNKQARKVSFTQEATTALPKERENRKRRGKEMKAPIPKKCAKKKTETGTANRNSLHEKGLTEKKLEERRRKEREKKRKQREKLLANPEALAKRKEYERKRSQKRRERGEFKTIGQMKKREQNEQRKKWRESARRRKQKIIAERLAAESAKNEKKETERKKAGRKKIHTNRTRVYKELLKTKEELKQSRSLTEKWKKRYYKRDVHQSKGSPSPRKSVKRLMKRGRAEISKRLLFSEALISQLKTRSRNLRTERQRQLFAKCVSGGILKKYRCAKQAKVFLSPYHSRKNVESASLRYYRKQKATAISEKVKNTVREFLEEDIHSCMAPGKRDTITFKGMKKQKRYLMDTLEHLHSKFAETTKMQISYQSFTRCKPFWIVKPKVCGTDTCLCIKCANADFLAEKLHMLKLIKHNKAAALAKDLCCKTRRKECSYGECERCKDKCICPALPESKMSEQTTYNKWAKKKEDRVIRKNEKTITVNIVCKEKVVCSIEELLCEAEKQFPIYLQHAFNAVHQYISVTELKKSLRSNEAILLIDFSENFVCKYANEVQSVHFGASKSQVTLHTGVLYTKKLNPECQQKVEENEDENYNCTSFCTISASLRHDPSAVWAHLKPVLEMVKQDFPDIDTIHFQSDGPTTQYRNKTNFFLLTYYCSALELKEATWNFSEAGHGKGPADGIGGLVKRTADQEIAHGSDITNVCTLIDSLKKSNISVKLFEVMESQINEIDKIIPNDLKPVKNTMKLYQLVWSQKNSNVLGLRSLSCTVCGTSSCKHFTLSPETWTFPKAHQHLVPENNGMVTSCIGVQKGHWVAVLYEKDWYPGIVDDIDENKTLFICYMHRSGEKFYWPTIKDQQKVPEAEILCQIKEPPQPISSRFFSIKNFADIDKLSSY